MSTIYEQVVAILNASNVAGGRIYPNVAPDAPVAPYVVYSRIASVPEVVMEGGQPIQQTRFQFDVYDLTYKGCDSVAQSLIATIDASSLQSAQLLEQDQYEPEIKSHRRIIDYSIWHY